MATPCWPKTGPKGGAGVASPALRLTLTTILTFLTIYDLFNLPQLKNTEVEILYPFGIIKTMAEDQAEKSPKTEKLVKGLLKGMSLKFLPTL